MLARWTLTALAAITLLTLVPTMAMAGASGCEQVPHNLEEIQNAVEAGSRLHAALDASGAEVAIVGRVGTDQRKRGIRYTHAGLSWRDHPGGRWHFIHELNHCERGSSQLFDDGPVDFFLERPFSYDAWVLIPTPEVQASIARLLRQGIDSAIHHPVYSAIAHPFNTRYQNSNQWLLELAALALEPNGPLTRERAQRILRDRRFQPARVELSFFERVGTVNMDNVALDDHRRSELRRGGYMYVSVRSLMDFFEQEGVALHSFELAQ